MSHIIIRVYSFECDAPDCNATLDVTPIWPGGLRASRKEARLSGWTSRDGQDFCREHADN